MAFATFTASKYAPPIIACRRFFTDLALHNAFNCLDFALYAFSVSHSVPKESPGTPNLIGQL